MHHLPGLKLDVVCKVKPKRMHSPDCEEGFFCTLAFQKDPEGISATPRLKKDEV